MRVGGTKKETRSATTRPSAPLLYFSLHVSYVIYSGQASYRGHLYVERSPSCRRKNSEHTLYRYTYGPYLWSYGTLAHDDAQAKQQGLGAVRAVAAIPSSYMCSALELHIRLVSHLP